jgi:hypothetical protein
MKDLFKRSRPAGRALALFGLLFVLPSLYSLTMKGYSILAHDRVEGHFQSYSDKAPIFEYSYQNVKKTYQAPGSDLYSFSGWDTVTLIINPDQPSDVFMYHYVDFLLLPLFGLGFGGFFMIFFFLTLKPSLHSQLAKVIEVSAPPRPHKFAYLFSLINLTASRLITIYYFICGFFFPFRHPEATQVLPWIYILEFFMCHSGVMMVAIPNSLKKQGKLAYHFSFMALTCLYLLFVLMIGHNNLSTVLQIYLGVVMNRFIMHFDENETAKDNSMAISGISGILFLGTIVLCAVPSFIPEGALTQEVTAKLFAGFRSRSSVDPYRLIFGGTIYFILLFICELSILRKSKTKS